MTYLYACALFQPLCGVIDFWLKMIFNITCWTFCTLACLFVPCTWCAHLIFNKLNLIKWAHRNKHVLKFNKNFQCIQCGSLCLCSFAFFCFCFHLMNVHLFCCAKKVPESNLINSGLIWFHWIEIPNFIEFGVFIEIEWMKADMCGVYTAVYGYLKPAQQ